MSRRSEKLLLVLVVSLVTIFGTGLYAQENVGHIRGTVSDATGAVIPEVTVNLKHEATGVVREVATNSAGAYAFIRLPLGEYTVRTRAEGFKSGERLLRIVSFVTQTVDFTLEIGDVTETVSVTAQVLTVDTSSNVVGTTRTTEEITELPLLMSGSARSATDFLRTMPGVIFSPTDQLTDQAFISGAPQGGAAYQIDGLMASVSGHGQVRDSQTPEPEGFEEFRLSNNTNAEYGWNSGVQISLVTKSGTNDLHGTLYHYLRNEALDSAGWLSGTVSKNKQNEWGLFVGGPLVKNRLFATFGYKAYRFRVEPNNATLSAPTALMRQGDFSEWLGPQISNSTASEGQIYDPATTRSDGAGGFLRDPFPNNAIPQGRLSPISQFLQEPYPLPNQPGTLSNWIGSTLKNFNDLNRYQTKVDYYLDSQARHRVSFFYSHLDGVRQLGGTFPNPRVTSAFGIIDGAYRTRMHYDWTVSPTLLFGLRLGFNRTPDSNLIAVDGARTQGCDSGLQGTITCETPSISFDNGTTGMGFFFSNVKQQEQTLPAAADLNWTKGNHNIKIGVQYLSNVSPQNVTAESMGAFAFSSRETGLPGFGATGNGYASFLLGEIDSGGIQSPQDARWSTNTWGFYVQDSWRVRPKLTLNYGLRWDLFLPMREGYDRIANFDLNRPNPGMNGLPGALTFFGEGPGRNGRKGIWDTYTKAVSPRFGLAYSLTDKTLIRASYGLSAPAFFGLYGSGFRIRTTGFMQLRATFQSIDNGVTPAFNWNDGVPDVTRFFAGGVTNLDPAIANGSAHPIFFPEQSRPGLNQNINFGIERDLGGGLILRSDYVGLLANGLPSDGHVLLNQIPLSALSLGTLLNNPIDSPAAIEAGIQKPYPSFEGSVAQALRPFPAFQTVNDLSSPTMNMQYHSLQTTLQKRFGHGLNFLFAYTISKTLANGGGFGGQGQASGRGDLQHTDQRGALKGLFANDRPQQINLSYLYELPFGPGKRFGGGITNPVVKHLVGGWRLSAIHHYWRESPIKVTTSSAVPGGLQSIWANREQGQISTGQGCGDYSRGDVSLNAGAFSVPLQPSTPDAPFQLGDTRILPGFRPCGYMNENIAIQKIFPFRERYNVEFAAEFINIFNRHNMTSLQTNISNPGNFGQYTGVTLPRRIQFHLKVKF